MSNLNLLLKGLKKGKIVAYPTESVFGIGCDPDNLQAIQKLLWLKQRPISKGLILVASSYQQLLPYIDETQLTQAQLKKIHATWPGPITWTMPSSSLVSNLLSGQFNSIAVRVSNHPTVKKICCKFGKPLISTSANLTGQKPCIKSVDIKKQFGKKIFTILDEETGNQDKPSKIFDAKTFMQLR
ncbi:tRNA threonylcarbamoyladenosine biosynthesis protein [Candidatus Photodesmus katoptron]|uniref:Threonylcarbamoyl-AMP synthase n=1 Tax=Candidatus Photodesmus katoptron Akat1 TaxID=1236703 RepID=S3DFI9_9GAMM|nr:L-threonylcarbamoyladenylate synthase [Candidatus Photodesmus katoptron]EPE37177.1 ribosome maturation factor [Candidatus Photodesmus katoptron Akat1]KEY90723.1 tRNA threonylcarbamoyladenosine biosynthesis protein [Candidatus Photodesmus katoptron]